MIALALSLGCLGVIAAASDRLARCDGESRASRATRMSLAAFATVVVVEAVLGAVGLLTPAAVLVALALVAAAATALARRRPRVATTAREPVSPVDVGLLAALIAAFALRLWAGLHRTTFLYDTLSYHLHVPATWMHDGRTGIVPAVFGDPSSAYAPANVELWLLFLMAPLRSDYLAGVGQLPFAALAAAAIVAAVREAGGRRAAGLGAALAFLSIPEIWGQMATAMTDLGLAACLLASLPFAIRLARGAPRRRADLLAAAVALGLAVGSKYAAAALAIPFAALAAAGWLRHRPRDVRGAALALVAALATGGFWYARNAAVTGNPLYPVAFPGLPLPALYGGAEMRAWDYHLPVADLGALGAMLLDAGAGFVIAAVVATVRLWRRAEAWLLLALVSSFWLAVPYQESRFLFAAFGVAACLVSRAVDRPPALLGWCGIVVAIAGALLAAPTRERLLVLPIGAAAALAFWRWRPWLARLPAWAVRLGGATAALAVTAAVGVGAQDYARRDPGYAVGDDLDAAWAWFRANVRDARVAYTGTNLAFPLAGERLANRVGYVNVAGRPGDRLHDFGPPGDGTAEPAPYRRGASADAWIANLRATRTEVLFVAALYPIVRRTIAADADGFPIERAWADARPDLFHLRYASAAARVYGVEAR
ncbi:MAG TPA: phospholipid carrier-dependent glycosyltransferase [Polyangia bacterium]|jgi:hypothetical protein